MINKKNPKSLGIVITILMFSLCIQTIKAQGPSSPEAAGFEPVDATDMVSLSTGNLSYVLPLLDVEGFPVSLSYHAGITADMDASWVGLGWYLTPGAINRSVMNTPDDWKSGVGINFNSYSITQKYFGISVEVGFPGAATVGVGLNWGGGQGLSGSVNATLGIGAGTGNMVQGGISAGASTTGNASLGGGIGVSIGSYRVGANISYSLKGQWNLSGGVDYNLSDNGAFVGAGYASNGTMSITGAGNNNTGKKSGNPAAGNSGGIGMGSDGFSSGDASVDAQSTGAALPLHFVGIPITLGFSKTKVRIDVKKGFLNEEWGALYSSDFSGLSGGNPTITNIANYDEKFVDYMIRTRSMDTYSTRLPQSEEEFIADASKTIENINFTFLGYDSYNVAAQGLMGNLSPRVFQNATIYGKGQRTKNEAGDNLHIFWHHANTTNAAQRKFAYHQDGYNVNDLYFYFDGQFTSTEKNDISSVSVGNLSTANELNDFISPGIHTTTFSNTYGRAKSPNFVEVFTNSQIANGHATARGLISPATIPNSNRTNTAKFDPDGIGAYKVTAPDGKTYHFALPVYHFEQVHRGLIDQHENATTFNVDNVNEKRQFSRYATHWMLTAITGSDYVDRPDPGNSNVSNTFNKEDYGYWVELEYGKWSDGYVWRSPYEDRVYNYNTNLLDDIEDKDKGSYSFGRKQLYYLDKINTKNKTALFVKELRHDAIGKNLKFRFDNANNGGSIFIGNTGSGGDPLSINYNNAGVDVKESGVEYKREYTLKLSKIVLVNSEVGKNLSKDTSGTLGSMYSGYVPNDSCLPNWDSGYFNTIYGSNYLYPIHSEQNVLDINDVTSTFITQNALKVIELNHDYDLAENSPSSQDAYTGSNGNASKGKLTLNSIQVKGKGGVSYMPPTVFDYYFKDKTNLTLSPTANINKATLLSQVTQKKNFMDAWGFLQGTHSGDNAVKAWSLKDITMPTGAKIEIDYEEDNYWTEAFSRRYWEGDLKFDINSIDSQTFEIKITKDPNSTLASFDFTDYFDANDKVSFDFYLCTVDEDYNFGCNVKRNEVNIAADNSNSIYAVTSGQLTLRLSKSQYLVQLQNSEDIYNPLFTLQSGFGTPIIQDRGTCPNPSGCHDGFNLVYKLLANKVPENETGGGLRVKELRTIDGPNTYKVTYNYDHPTLNRSSGVTSYAPIDGLKYVPYQSEIPAPGVMYEYVTMSETSNTGDFDSETRYRHHVLKPVHNIFNPNIQMEALDANADGEDNIFWANVTENYGSLDGNNARNVTAKKVDLHVNNALIGQIKSIENINKEGHVMLITKNEYINGTKLVSVEPNKGYVKETFNSMKTVFKTNESGTIVDDAQRLLSVSSKTEYNNMLRKSISIAGGQSSSVEYSDVDPWLSSFRKSETTMADGTKTQSYRIPAYEKYTGMQSKAIDPSNKNMLTQEAMNITNVQINESWKTISASVSTWKDSWDHVNTNAQTTTVSGLWRRHQNFVWKDDVDANGTYGTYISANSFNWGIGASQTNAQWQKASEITKYTLWSSPVETMDINGNYASSKKADLFSKTIAGGNARYTEMYYSGAEYVDNGNMFEGEVLGANYRSSNTAHTGSWSVRNTSSTDKVFEIDKPVNNDASINAIRPGDYKVSFWATNTHAPILKMNGTTIAYNSSLTAGDWTQYNYYLTIPSGISNVNINVTSIATGRYFDDFRMLPIASTMNSFVYNQDTDELIAVLDANNMATIYCYDEAGRLCTTYAEVVNQVSETGGFKIVGKNNYNYKGLSTSNSCHCIVYQNITPP